MMLKNLTLFILFFTSLAYAKVDPPNYDFSLKKFDLFMPGNKLVDIEKEYKEKEVVFNKNGFITYKFSIEQLRFKFPILVQFKDGVVLDFHARLPQYFLHDIFHQSLINRLGVQDIYKKVDEHAVYIWKNKKDLNHYYSGACTITCFPIFYAVKKTKPDALGNYKPLIDQFTSKL